MAALKHSKQRDSIKAYLASTVEHPTADTVYMHVKEDFPNISLGTVYRNLNLLADIGEALKITTADGGDRFDGDVSPHYHVVCNHCGSVSDLKIDSSQIDSITEIADHAYEGKIESHSTLFYGICPHCLKKET